MVFDLDIHCAIVTCIPTQDDIRSWTSEFKRVLKQVEHRSLKQFAVHLDGEAHVYYVSDGEVAPPRLSFQQGRISCICNKGGERHWRGSKKRTPWNGNRSLNQI